MQMRRIGFLLSFLVTMQWSAADIQKAGMLLIDLNATDVAGVGENGKVSSWANRATTDGGLGDSFKPAVAGQGPVFKTYAGASAVYFAGSANSILTGMVASAHVTGTKSWTLETWINTPVLGGTSSYFSWTYRIATAPNNRLFEARWTSDAGNAIEHYSNNVGWNNRLPIANQWHHIVFTRRESDKMEFIYVDGSLVTELQRPDVNILTDGIFILGGTQNSGRTGFELFATTYISQLRLHSGFMSQEAATANYLAERGTYGQNAQADSVWAGAAGQPLPWESAANWQNGLTAGTLSRTFITNNGLVTLTSNIGTLAALIPSRGGLTLSGSAQIDVNQSTGNYSYFGNGSGNTFTLNILEGSLSTLNLTNSNHMAFGANSGTGLATIGGGTSPALLHADRDIRLGYGNGCTARVEVQTNGTLRSRDGYVIVGAGSGSDGKLTVNGGTLDFVSTQRRLVLVDGGGKAVLELNSGLVRPEFLYFAQGTGVSSSYAAAFLNGGILDVAQITQGSTTGTNLLYLNGGVIRNRTTHTSFLQNLTAGYVQAGGATFDVLSNTTITVAQPLLHSPELGATADGGLRKSGFGSLILTGTNTLSGALVVEQGALLFNNVNAFLSGYAGTITLSSPTASIGFNKSGALSYLLAKLTEGSTGSLALMTNNAAESIDLSSYPNLSLAISGTFTYTGTYTPATGYAFNLVSGSAVTYNTPLTGARSLRVYGDAKGSVTLKGDNNYTGGTSIEAGKVVLGHVNALGTTGTISLQNNAALTLDVAALPPDFFARLATDSVGYLFLTGASSNLTINLSNHPGIKLGTDRTILPYTGTLTPSSDAVYHLGGGSTVFRLNSNQGLILTNLTDAADTTPRKVIVEGEGIVRIYNSNYSGGILLSNSAALFVTSDNAFGATPAMDDPDNVVINGGAIRLGDVSINTHSNRGLVVGTGGCELHPWGSRQLNWQGKLYGSAPIFTSDSGEGYFADLSNYTGAYSIESGATLGVGSGDKLVWNPAVRIYGASGYFGINNNMNTNWSTTIQRGLGTDGTASFGLRKRGTGTLTLDMTQNFTGNTVIDSGILKPAFDGAISYGSGKGSVIINAAGKLDVDGQTINVNGLSGTGQVIGQGTLRVGNNGASATYSGATAADKTMLVKTGTGTLTTQTRAVWNATVEQGTLTMANPYGPRGELSLQSNTTLNVSPFDWRNAYPKTFTTADATYRNGLLGAYYFIANVGNLSMDSYTKIIGIYTNTPYLISNSWNAQRTTYTNGTEIIPYFDFGCTDTAYLPCVFPTPFNDVNTNKFIAVWRGWFDATNAATYTFGTVSDDGSVIYINGSLVVNNNKNQSYNPNTMVTGSIDLAQGLHEIVISYFEDAGGQGLTVYQIANSQTNRLSQALLTPPLPYSDLVNVTATNTAKVVVSTNAGINFVNTRDTTFAGILSATNSTYLGKSGSATLTFTTTNYYAPGQTTVTEGELNYATLVNRGPIHIQTNAAVRLSAASQGLLGRYYDIAGFTNRYFTVLSDYEDYLSTKSISLIASSALNNKTDLNFGTDGGGFAAPYNTKTRTNFQVIWRGSIIIPQTGTYTFYTASDDGSMLFINGIPVVNNNYYQGVTERSGTITLTAGAHDFALSFYQGSGGYGLTASIAGPGMTKQFIPNAMLTPTPATVTSAYAPQVLAGLSGYGHYFLNTYATEQLVDQVDYTFAGNLHGDTLTAMFKNGPATWTIAGDNSDFAGRWLIAKGTLRLQGAGNLGAGIVSMASNAVLDVNTATNVTIQALTGSGAIRIGAAASMTLAANLDSFTGTLQNNGTLTLKGAATTIPANRITGVGTIKLEHGAVLNMSEPTLPIASELVVSNGVLALAITNASTWTIDALTLHAPGTLSVRASGLFGRYYDVQNLNTTEVYNAFLSVESALAFVQNPAKCTYQFKSSTWEVGNGLDYGNFITDPRSGNVFFPGKYAAYSNGVTSANNFIVIWKGKIAIQQEGRYAFRTYSDDNSMLFINNQVVVDNNGGHGPTFKEGSTNLTAGVHDLCILFCQQGGGYGMRADIVFPGSTDYRALPNEILIAEPEDIPDYRLNIAELQVVNGGTATLACTPSGTLGLADVGLDTQAKLVFSGAGAAIIDTTLRVTLASEVERGSPTWLVDFTQSAGFDVSGKQFEAFGTDGRLFYRDKILYVTRTQGAILILR